MTTRPNSFRHAVRLAAYNRPLYVAAAIAIGLFIAVICIPSVPGLLRVAAASGAAVVTWFVVASFFAFHWMFDRSGLLDTGWVERELGRKPMNWVQINAGLDETTIPLHDLFPEAPGDTFDIYNPQTMTEPAIARAHRAFRSTATVSAKAAELPIIDASRDLVLVTLAAHEIRDSKGRENFFERVARIVSAEGAVIIVEHPRNAWAFAAFGLGSLHFYPRREWLRLGAHAGLRLLHEHRMTPFIHIFLFHRATAKLGTDTMAEPL